MNQSTEQKSDSSREHKTPGGVSDVMRDLELTVQELSHTYEELSLLYKLSEVLSGMTLDEIAEEVVKEAISTLDIRTASLLLYDEREDKLYTKSCRGRWDKKITIDKEDRIIWSSIEERKPVAYCKLAEAGFADYSLAERSILVCPLIGKTKIVGAMVLADKESGGEFFSTDIKLMMAISTHAALTIENALLYKELEDFLLSAIKSLVKALEASTQWTAGHTERVTEYAMGIGRALGLSKKELEELKIASLLHDIGKIAIPKHILDKPDKLTEDEMTEVKRHPVIGAEILGEFKRLENIVLGIKYHHEHWNGNGGLLGVTGNNIPLIARILAVADAFDAMTSDRPYRRKRSLEDAVAEILNQSDKQFDPSIVEAFKKWVNQQYQAF
jgi:putative nucleotidyltransferase with HDIG domain